MAAIDSASNATGIVDINAYLPREITAPTLRSVYPPFYPIDPWNSDAAISDIPNRYLGQIVSCLEEQDLRSLALVNTDFRRLARAAQDVYLRINKRTHMHTFLRQNISNREQAEHLGCIRFLDLADMYSPRNRNKDKDRNTSLRQTRYLLENTLKNLPRLETLVLSYLKLTKASMIALLDSSIRRLRVTDDIIINDMEDHEFWEISNIAKLEWRLDSLEAQSILYESDTRGDAVRDLLWMCRTTLERFACIEDCMFDIGLANVAENEEEPTFVGFRMPDTSMIKLPKLRHLTCVRLLGVRIPKTFAMLSILNLWAEAAPNFEVIRYEGGTGAFQEENVESLPVLVHLPSLKAIQSEFSTILPLLKNNQQVTVFDNHTYYPEGNTLLCQHFHRLCDEKVFDNLTSLSLYLGEAITKETLACVAQLPRLEQLLLESSYWPIDHDEVLAALEPLEHLQYLAFMPDVFKSASRRIGYREDGSWRGRYEPFYSMLSEEEIKYFGSKAETKELRTMRDQVHHDLMHSIAKRYALTFPKLEWIFVGCYPFLIVERKGRSLSTRRLVGTELFHHIFGVTESGKIFRPVEERDIYRSPY